MCTICDVSSAVIVSECTVDDVSPTTEVEQQLLLRSFVAASRESNPRLSSGSMTLTSISRVLERAK